MIKPHRLPLYVQDKEMGNAYGQPKLLVAFVRGLWIKPVFDESRYTREQLAQSEAIRRAAAEQMAREYARRSALDKICDDIRKEQTLDTKWIKQLFPDDIENIITYGDAYLLQLVEDTTSDNNANGMEREIPMPRSGTNEPEINNWEEWQREDTRLKQTPPPEPPKHIHPQPLSPDEILRMNQRAAEEKKEKRKKQAQQASLLSPQRPMPKVRDYTPRSARDRGFGLSF